MCKNLALTKSVGQVILTPRGGNGGSLFLPALIPYSSPPRYGISKRSARPRVSRTLLSFLSRPGVFSRSGKPIPMEVYAIKVTLLDTRPPIWRHVLVHREITLHNLHKTLQTVMGWTNSHLHQFVFKRQKYSDPRHGLGGRDS